MTHTYKYELVGGHIIAIDDQCRFLIDTGAPSSVADSAPIEFVGGSYRAQRNYMGISPESLSLSVGTSINALVEADILNRYDIFIDPTTQTLNMSEDELPLAEQVLELDDVMGIPIIEVMVGEDKVRVFFDTGAKLLYSTRVEQMHSNRLAQKRTSIRGSETSARMCTIFRSCWLPRPSFYRSATFPSFCR